MTDRLQAADRPFRIALTISLGCHLAFVAVQLILGRHAVRMPISTALEVIYETPPKAPPAPARHVEETIRERLRTSRALAPAPGSGLGGLAGEIRIPERAMTLLAPAPGPGLEPTRSAVVDLGNVADAAQGDPVLLSYFIAIRDQIQRTANRQTWNAQGSGEGMVYVTFALSSGGQIQSASSVRNRSIASGMLQELAVNIVKRAGPFAPFPPSVGESTKTIVIPLEFLLNQ